jgi:hypothetical protein
MWLKASKYMGGEEFPNAKKFKCAQLPWKLVAPATQAMCKCLMSKNVHILREGGSISIHIHVTVFFP